MEHGFIRGSMEIKILLLYLLARMEVPVDFCTLTDAALCDEGVGYFDFTSALAELVDTGNIAQEAGRYAITEKGRKNGAVIEDELPYSVRLRCDRKLAEIEERLQRERLIHAEVTQTSDGGWRTELRLEGEEENRFTLGISLPLREDARALADRFRADPEEFIRRVADLADRPQE